MADTTTPLRQAITLAYRRDEAACVAALAAGLQAATPAREPVAARARALAATVRRERRRAGGVDQLMHEFALSSQEGVALMCLAEALLRIPDAATAERLIRDKIGGGDWRAHLGHSPSLFVNAAAWGLVLTGELLAPHSHSALGEILDRLVARGGEPLIRRAMEFAMQLLGQQFVMGESIEAALERSKAGERRGYTHSFDMLGEGALTAGEARRYQEAYEKAIRAIGRAGAGRDLHSAPGISIKLSALHPRYCRAQRERVLAELLPRLKALCRLARHHGIGLNIDAEEAERLELSLDLLQALAGDPELAGWPGLGFVVQAYQKRCPFVIDHLIDLARRNGRRLMLRLVKGAYWDGEIKRAQVEGLADYPVYTRKVHTDLAYLACARRLLAAPDAVYPQFATHNAHTLAYVMEMADAMGVADYEFQCLHGMGEALYDQVVGRGGDEGGRRCRIYAPVGSHRTLLPYLVRRLLENGANSSFVHRLADTALDLDELVADPLDAVLREGGQPHPRIPLPAALYGETRRNSAGVDLSDEPTLAALERDLAALSARTWEAFPVVAGCPPRRGPARAIANPAKRSEHVGSVIEAGPEEVAAALAAAHAYAGEWAAVPRERRAALLQGAADLLEARRNELISLCVREAGKTWGNAVAEVREAEDFCRYYAQQILTIAPDRINACPGPVACISPWNFPLAIFLGEVAAALAAGSPVLAKPAEQTPLVAAFAVELLHRAGIPAAALQFLPGGGETVGAALVADPRVRGVLLTGATETARHIDRSLAARPAGAESRLIAETGGLNAMIVDSSALLEQVVQDVLVSGFDSAGQRCSALRLLCLQEDIAERLLALLRDAMRELTIGDPRHLATDIGPVIDDEAKGRLEAHIAAMRQAGKPVFQPPLPLACAAGSFVAPTLIEIGSPDELRACEKIVASGPRLAREAQPYTSTVSIAGPALGRAVDFSQGLAGEVFGPVVHVLRFAGERLDPLVEAINAGGYGLTFGLHSRIGETIGRVLARIRAGNIYVNRNMVGAVVGVQPFGGEGKSGTGPKAGGPLYLHRLLDSANVAPAELGLAAAGCDADTLAPLQALRAWAERADTRLARACAEYAALSLLPHRFRLPGPTGESNTLAFAPRGPVLCLAVTEAGLLEQIAACLASGNLALATAGKLATGVLAKLPPTIGDRVAIVAAAAPRPSAVLQEVPLPRAAWDKAAVEEEAAAADGVIVPVIPPGADGRYPIHRLLCERTITINTAAAGGNASLMSLET